MSVDKVKELFMNPDSRYRTAPLWVWNADMTDSEIEMSLTKLKEQGFGGAFVHPRPGMKVNYLDEHYFKAWAKALETAKRLGLKLNIYDENSYPSGFGGGHVSMELPDCLAESITYNTFDAAELAGMDEKENWLGNYKVVAAYAYEDREVQKHITKDVTDVPRSEWCSFGDKFIVLEHCLSTTAGWTAGFANVDLLRPEVSKMFLEKVYDKYAAHFQEDFGDTIQAIFTDEPSLSGSFVYGSGDIVDIPINYWFGYEFQKRKGYSIISCLPALFEDFDNYENEKIRHDYYEVIWELWKENFLIPIHEWCMEHKIPFTGHFMEDGWPKPFYAVVAPCPMASYEHQDWPGIDLLQTMRLKDSAVENQQISILEVMSAAHQFGKERVFCEAFGAGGYDSGLEDYKRIGDYLFVSGVNYINEHLTYTSYVGARKRDHPQSFDWRQPWWPEYKELNEYFARLSAVLSAGEALERTLIINPTMTGFISKRDQDTSQLIDNQLAAQPDMTGFLNLINTLRCSQRDFNLGDEMIIKEHGKVDSGKFHIVRQEYDVVILHECMKNMLETTLVLLEQFMNDGGKVLSIGQPGPFVAGVNKAQRYQNLFANENFIQFDSQNDMIAFLNQNYRRSIIPGTTLPFGVESIRRILDDGTQVYFIVNHSRQDISTELEFHGAYAECWDLWTAQIRKAAESVDDRVCVPISLKDGESKLIAVYPEVKSAVYDGKTPDAEDMSAVNTEILYSKIYPESQNVWPLEYCDLAIDRESYQDISTIQAGIKIFKQRGYVANPWDNKVQFKNRYYEQNQFYDEGSGFSLTYYFAIADNYLPEQLCLSVEYGERYRIYINDKLVEKEVAGYFIDELIRSYDIHEFVHSGTNTIKLTAQRFDVELEAEPVTLRGEFGVYARDGQWVMDKAAELKTGSWRDQGYPFYYGAVIYQADLAYDGEKKVFLKVPHNNGTATSVLVNEQYAGVVNLNGISKKEITSWLRVGDNGLKIRVCGSFKNYLGPHFDPDKPRNRAWPEMWKRAPKEGVPKPECYDLIEYGLTGNLQVIRRPA